MKEQDISTMKPLYHLLSNLPHDGVLRGDISTDDLKMDRMDSSPVAEKLPFVSGKREHFDRLEDEIRMYIRWAALTEVEKEQRSTFLRELQHIIDKIVPGYKAMMFGSQAAETASYFSDIDICISRFPEHLRRELVKALQHIAPGANYISEARVPIIEGVYSCCNVDFDISFEQTSNMEKDISLEKQLSPPLRALLMLMKAYLRQRSLHTPHIGGLSGHLLMQLILALSQNRQKYFRYKISDRWPCASFLLEFLQFYGTMFNYNSLYIYRTSNGKYSFERRGNQIYCDKVKGHGLRPILCILAGDRDISGGVYNYRKIQESFDFSYLRLLENCESGTGILGSVIGVDKIGLTTRKLIEEIAVSTIITVHESSDSSEPQGVVNEI